MARAMGAAGAARTEAGRTPGAWVPVGPNVDRPEYRADPGIGHGDSRTGEPASADGRALVGHPGLGRRRHFGGGRSGDPPLVRPRRPDDRRGRDHVPGSRGRSDRSDRVPAAPPTAGALPRSRPAAAFCGPGPTGYPKPPGLARSARGDRGADRAPPLPRPPPRPPAVRPPPGPSPAALRSASNAVRRAAAVGSLDAVPAPAASSAPTTPSSVVGPSGEPGGRGLTSIPGAYLQALDAQRDPSAAWAAAAPPVAAPLPFAAGVQRPAPEAPSTGTSADATRTEELEMELARLRARVRELEARRPPILSGISAQRPPPNPTAAAPRAPEPPAPPAHVAAAGPRGCAGCGQSLGGPSSPALCWGCGRALCTNCYWRFGPGPGLHRCPDCLAKSARGSTGISGGRATRPTTSDPARAPPPISPPASR